MKASMYFNYTTRSLLRGGQRTILAVFCVAVGVMAIVSLQLVGQMINGAFTMPGDGAVDFNALLSILNRSGYRGWLVVEAEQDPVVAPSYRYAEMGFWHLAKIVERLQHA